MANARHWEILRQGAQVWNRWREENNIETVDLSNAPDFEGIDLGGANLKDVDLFHTNLRGANLRRATLRNTNLSGVNLSSADLSQTAISANFEFTDLRDANLSGAVISFASFWRTLLSGTDFLRARISGNRFSEIDFSEAKNLETVFHLYPSNVDIDTVYLSRGRIPNSFLQGCGVPESFIAQIPALIGALQPIQFHSCFISYSGKDEEFARRLHSRMREAELRVWFAPEDMKGGDKLYDQIDRAIQVHDRLLLVLSESSLRSKWVELEIRRARKTELREGRRKLFPIRLVSYEALQEWVCIDSATGEDLAEEVRSYFIPDFTNWKNHDDFEQAFARLLSDLKASA